MKEIILAINTTSNSKWKKNDLINELKIFIENNKEKELQFSLYFFNQTVRSIYEHAKINEILVNNIKINFSGEADIYTSLGTILEKTSDRINHLKGSKKPEEVLFCIMSEDFKNISNDYSKEEINTFITYQIEDYNWNIMFFGIDVKKEIEELGIKKENIHMIDCTKDGLKKMFNSLQEKV